MVRTKPRNTEPEFSVAEMMDDMDQHLRETGADPSLYPVLRMDAPRTRYKKPGQGSGRGVVRKLTDPQVEYIIGLMEQKQTDGLVLLPGAEDVRNMSKQGARDLIDRLLRLPDRPGFVPRATGRMMDLIRRLMAEKLIPDTSREWLERNTADGRKLTFDHAKRAIEMLFAAPKPPPVTRPAPGTVGVDIGMYELPTGEIYLVRRARKPRTDLYALLIEIVDGKRIATYVKGAIRKLTPDMRMSIERAEELTLSIGECIVCGRELTNGKSVKLGIGPICRGYF